MLSKAGRVYCSFVGRVLRIDCASTATAKHEQQYQLKHQERHFEAERHRRHIGDFCFYSSINVSRVFQVCEFVRLRVEALRREHPGLYQNVSALRTNSMLVSILFRLRYPKLLRVTRQVGGSTWNQEGNIFTIDVVVSQVLSKEMHYNSFQAYRRGGLRRKVRTTTLNCIQLKPNVKYVNHRGPVAWITWLRSQMFFSGRRK